MKTDKEGNEMKNALTVCFRVSKYDVVIMFLFIKVFYLMVKKYEGNETNKIP